MTQPYPSASADGAQVAHLAPPAVAMDSGAGPHAQYLLDTFGEHLVGLIQYGSTVFGETRTGSVHDFWLVVMDAARFHTSPAMRAVHRANHDDSIHEHIALNAWGPNFYAIEHRGLRMKVAVIALDTFVRLCQAPIYVVKGRMQKPLRILRTCPAIEAGILAARRDGVAEAINLLPREFTFEEFLHTVVGLSYQAEIRPEFKRKKIASIVATGRDHLEAIYRPLLVERPEIELVGNIYRDRRSEAQKQRARRHTCQHIRRTKWSRASLRIIWKNYRTHADPLHYMYLKVRGEFEKLLRRTNGPPRAHLHEDAEVNPLRRNV